MRTIPPEDPNPTPPKEGPIKRELIFRWIIPLPFWGGTYFLGLLMGRELTNGAQAADHGMGGRLASLALLAAFLFVLISGIFFVLYLIKSLLGIDLFSTAHLME